MVVQSKLGAGASSDTRLLVRVLVGDDRDFNCRRRGTSGVPSGIAQSLTPSSVNFSDREVMHCRPVLCRLRKNASFVLLIASENGGVQE